MTVVQLCLFALRAVLYLRIELSVTGYALYKSHIIIIMEVSGLPDKQALRYFSATGKIERELGVRTNCAHDLFYGDLSHMTDFVNKKAV